MLCQQAFLESYLTPGPTLQYNSECWQALQWTLVSEASVTSPLRHGTEFQLKNNHFCLVVSSKAIPQLRISEEYVHPKSHKFVLQVQSETSVWPSAVSVTFIHNKLRSSVSFFTFFLSRFSYWTYFDMQQCVTFWNEKYLCTRQILVFASGSVRVFCA